MKPVVMTLGDVCTKGSSNLAQKDLDGNSGEYEIYGASGLIKKVNFFHQEKPYIAVVKDGAGVGRTMLLPAKTSVIGTMQYIIPNENIDIEYLYYAITYMDLSRYYMGAAIPHIYFKDYCKEKILVPDIDIQKAIAHKFRIIDGLITARQEQLAKLWELIASRFIEMFGDPFVNNKRWEVQKIADVITEVRYGTSRPAVDGGKYPYLRMNNLTNDGHLDISNLKYIDIPDNEIDKCVVHKGDILFNRTNSIELVGKTAVFDLDEDMVIAGYIIRIRLKPCLLPEIVSQYMNLPPVKELLRSMAKGAVNQANINAQELQSIHIYVPDIKLQNKFVEFKHRIDKSKVAVQISITKCHYLTKKGVNTHA